VGKSPTLMRDERTLALIKPDVSGDASAVDQIRQSIKSAGLHIVREERKRLTVEQAEDNYAEYLEKRFFPVLVEFITSGDVVAMELEALVPDLSGVQ
jgi:nucleoside-diphosphate kinase